MASPIFYDRTYDATGEQAPLPLNRWSRNNYSIVLDIGTTGDVTVEATVNQLNRNDGLTPIWFELAGLTNITTDITDTVTETPLEAIRLNITAVDTTVRLQVMQSGEC